LKVHALKPALAIAAAALALGSASAASAATRTADHTLPSDSRFYVEPNSDAAKQAVTDVKTGDLRDALTMAKLASWPEATWFTSGTPSQVAQQVSALMRGARRQDSVPVLVAYDIPLRDCGQYSSGGATSDAAYRQWIAAFAGAIGQARAVVVLEPDALANLPQDCSPTTDPTGALTAARMADLRYAVSVLKAQPRTSVYLDAGNSQWHAVGDIAQRLIDADVADTQGFSLNVSNYQPTDQSDHYGTWVAKCIWFATAGPSWAIGHASWCASQYYSPAAPNDGLPGDAVSSTDPSTWHWTDDWFTQNTAGAPVAQLTHFVVDTSRNGLGAWTPPAGTSYPDSQTWCNPPGRGMGARPTADTGVPLADAYLYIKTVGQSDGSCTRGTAGPGDPVYGGAVDPAAGVWWPSQALTLAGNAVPTLRFNFDLG